VNAQHEINLSELTQVRGQATLLPEMEVKLTRNNDVGISEDSRVQATEQKRNKARMSTKQ
jgi:N-acetylmuramoyl-L-alanine amidase